MIYANSWRLGKKAKPQADITERSPKDTVKYWKTSMSWYFFLPTFAVNAYVFWATETGACCGGEVKTPVIYRTHTKQFPLELPVLNSTLYSNILYSQRVKNIPTCWKKCALCLRPDWPVLGGSSIKGICCCFDRSSQAAVVLPWRLSAAMSPYSPAVVWLNAGWSPDGGWDGSSSTTGITCLDLRYVAVSRACSRSRLHLSVVSRRLSPL